MRTILSGLLALVGFLPAQGRQLSAENVDPVAWHNGLLYTGTTITLPSGPVTFPTTLFAGLAPRLTLTANANAVTVRGSCFRSGFEVTFPPIPGLVFYAQGIAISGGTFVSTNGVRIQT